MAYSEEQRRSALETFIRFDHSYADTIAELGYPNRGTLRGWWREYERTGVVPVRKSVSDPTYTDAMKRAAVDYYLGHGRSLARTARALVMWQHLLEQIYERIRPASLNSTGLM